MTVNAKLAKYMYHCMYLLRRFRYWDCMIAEYAASMEMRIRNYKLPRFI